MRCGTKGSGGSSGGSSRGSSGGGISGIGGIGGRVDTISRRIETTNNEGDLFPIIVCCR